MNHSWNNIRYDFSGAAVLVTGGTGGIGAAIAAAFRDAGADVAITGTRKDASDYDADLKGYRYHRLDVEDRANIDSVAAAQPRLDVVVNSAGLAMFVLGLDEYEPDVFERAVAMHLTSVQRLAARCESKLSQSRLAGGASIISIGSMSSFFGIEAVPGYGAGKTGLLGFTRVYAIHWAPKRIRVNALAIGLTASGMTKPVMENADVAAMMLQRVPLGRHGAPEDSAGAALFLSSDAASWITGQTLCVDGGYSIAG